MNDFTGFGLPVALLSHLGHMQYTTPTPIQEQAIPLAMNGKDILGSAQTGTGKTAAFGIPLVARLMNNPNGSALVLAPTRELAVQIIDILKKLAGTKGDLRTALLIGGDSMFSQINQLRAHPRIIVGTPGRINDHLARRTLSLRDVNFLVLDETDRMLDMGFAPQIEKIIQCLPQQRQTLMFSATFPANILQLAGKYLHSPERISIGASNKAVLKIRQDTLYTTHEAKYGLLLEELSKRTGSVIIFVKTRRSADRLAEKLSRQHHGAEAIHGDLQQRKRDSVIKNFRDKKHRVLVATDIASRGLDIPHIEHVINYDLPQCPEDYIHRIGRTARAGAEGASLCLITPEDNRNWKAIHRLMHPNEAPPPHHPSGGSESAFRKKTGGKGSRERQFSSGPRHKGKSASSGARPSAAA